MRFNVTIIDMPMPNTPYGCHPFAHCLYDWARALAYTIRRLGKECVLTQNTIDEEYTNLILGAHQVNGGLEEIKAPYIVVQTELVDSRGLINHVENDCYIKVLQGAKAVWNEVWKCGPHIEKIVGDKVPVINYTGGYVPELEEISQDVEKDVDFLFFGSITAKRQIYLEYLRQKGYRTQVVFNQPSVYRNDMIARAKVHLAPCHDLPLGNTSIQRLTYLLNNKQVVLSETGSDHMEIAKCGVVASAGEFLDKAEEALELGTNIDYLDHLAYDKFKSGFPFTNEIKRLLDECEERDIWSHT